MVCKTHYLVTTLYSDMSKYSLCHYIVLSLYSAGIIVNHKGTIRVFEGSVGGEDGILGLDDGSRDLK